MIALLAFENVTVVVPAGGCPGGGALTGSKSKEKSKSVAPLEFSPRNLRFYFPEDY